MSGSVKGSKQRIIRETLMPDQNQSIVKPFSRSWRKTIYLDNENNVLTEHEKYLTNKNYGLKNENCNIKEITIKSNSSVQYRDSLKNKKNDSEEIENNFSVQLPIFGVKRLKSPHIINRGDSKKITLIF